MEINRPLVKQQAKDIIHGNVLKLFFIALVIGFLAGSSNPVSSISSNIGNLVKDKVPYSQSQGDNNGNDNDFFDHFNDFGNENGGNGGESDWGHFDGFDGNGKVGVSAVPGLAAGWGILAVFLLFLIMAVSVARLALAPLRVMLDGLFWQLIRGNNMSLGDGFKYIFKNAFDNNYWQKFLLQLVKSILLSLLYLLLIIPGVIFSYKWRFSTYILAEHPEMSFGDAMRASDKMTKGHKWELFVLDLSFIGWYLLMVPTLGLISIYVTPYVSAVVALYYENFKIRAYQEGAVTQFDFLSASQKTAMYQQSYSQYGYTSDIQNVNVYYQPEFGAQSISAPQAPAQQYMPQQQQTPVPPDQPVHYNYYNQIPPKYNG